MVKFLWCFVLLFTANVVAQDISQNKLLDTIHTAAEWEIAHHLVESKSIKELENLTHRDSVSLAKLLNTLSSLDLVEEVSLGVFTNTERGASLFHSLDKNKGWFVIARPAVRGITQFIIDSITIAVAADNMVEIDKEQQELWNEYKEKKEKLAKEKAKQKKAEEKEPIRTEPNNLKEKLTLDEARNKPQDELDEIMQKKIKDPRYPPEEWKKVSHTHKLSDGTQVEVHYWEHRITGEKNNFKFKNN